MRRVIRLLAAVAGATALWLLAVWPPPFWYRTHWPRATAFMTRPLPPPGRKLDPGLPGLHYDPIPLDSMAPSLADAAIAGEDNRFYQHHGIDYFALAQALGYPGSTLDWSQPRDRQALIAVLPRAWQERNRLRGASTITQQLAKNLYLSPSRNPLRKLKEAVTAWRLELALGKRRILELYLNVVELGRNLYGVEAASEHYFFRPAARLTPEQAAALAGSLPFPLSSNPGFRPGRMEWRQGFILRRLRGDSVGVPPVDEVEDGITGEGPWTEPDNATVDSAGAGGSADSAVPAAPAGPGAGDSTLRDSANPGSPPGLPPSEDSLSQRGLE